jgi:hypothetical protein
VHLSQVRINIPLWGDEVVVSFDRQRYARGRITDASTQSFLTIAREAAAYFDAYFGTRPNCAGARRTINYSHTCKRERARATGDEPVDSGAILASAPVFGIQDQRRTTALANRARACSNVIRINIPPLTRSVHSSSVPVSSSVWEHQSEIARGRYYGLTGLLYSCGPEFLKYRTGRELTIASVDHEYRFWLRLPSRMLFSSRKFDFSYKLCSNVSKHNQSTDCQQRNPW